jgi:hypothetical protein
MCRRSVVLICVRDDMVDLPSIITQGVALPGMSHFPDMYLVLSRQLPSHRRSTVRKHVLKTV